DGGRAQEVEDRQLPAGVDGGGVALEAGLMGAARAHVAVALGDPAGGLAHLVQPPVRPVEVPLLGGKLGVGAALSDAAIGLLGHARLLWGDLAVYCPSARSTAGGRAEGGAGR